MHRFQSALVCGPSVTSAAVYAWLRAHSGRGAWAVAEQGINPLVQLTLTPWFLHVLGREDFGVWMFSLTLLGMSQLVSLGAGIAAQQGRGERQLHLAFHAGRVELLGELCVEGQDA